MTYASIRRMKRTTVFLAEGAERDLKSLAARQGEPVASLIREAISEYLVRRKKERPALGFVAAGRSGRDDVATRHEELLWRDLAPHGDSATARKPRKASPRRPGKPARRPGR